jgi:hypothetical protein
MPRSALQSDFEITRGPVAELPAPASQAGALATRVTMWATVILLTALALLLAIGPHIPSGE